MVNNMPDSPLSAITMLLMVLAAACNCTDRDPIPVDGIALKGVTIIDGRGSPPQADRVVEIREGRIAAISPAADYTSTPGVEVHELGGHYVTPGFIDTHAHDIRFVEDNWE